MAKGCEAERLKAAGIWGGGRREGQDGVARRVRSRYDETERFAKKEVVRNRNLSDHARILQARMSGGDSGGVGLGGGGVGVGAREWERELEKCAGYLGGADVDTLCELSRSATASLDLLLFCFFCFVRTFPLMWGADICSLVTRFSTSIFSVIADVNPVA